MVGNGVVRRLIIHPAIELYAPEYLTEEIDEHRSYILKKVRALRCLPQGR